jgi:hypothetical protein
MGLSGFFPGDGEDIRGAKEPERMAFSTGALEHIAFDG